MPRPRSNRQSPPLEFPEVPPLDEILDRMGELEDFVKQAAGRNARRSNNGMPTDDRNPKIIEEREARLAEVRERFAADQQRPVTELVPEYVIEHDESGNYIGLRPASAL